MYRYTKYYRYLVEFLVSHEKSREFQERKKHTKVVDFDHGEGVWLNMFSGTGGKYNSRFVNRIVTIMNVEKVLVPRYKVSKSYS